MINQNFCKPVDTGAQHFVLKPADIVEQYSAWKLELAGAGRAADENPLAGRAPVLEAPGAPGHTSQTD